MLASRVAEAGPEGATSVLLQGAWESEVSRLSSKSLKTVLESQDQADPQGHRHQSQGKSHLIITWGPSLKPQTASLV